MPPHPPHEATVNLLGAPVHLWEGGEGPPLLFLHGAGSIGQSFAGAFPLLARHHRVLLPDLPGFGLSSENPRISTFRDLAGAIATLLRTVSKGPVDLMGNSMGGGLAAGVTLLYPELVRGLVLVAPGGLHPKEDTRMQAQKVVPGEVNRWLFHRPERGAAVLPTLSPEEVRERWRKTRSTLERWTSTGLEPVPFGDLQRPTLVLWGREDRILPSAWAHEIAEGIPGARAVVLEDCGHVPQLELPDVFAATVEEFLAGLPSHHGERN